MFNDLRSTVAVQKKRLATKTRHAALEAENRRLLECVEKIEAILLSLEN